MTWQMYFDYKTQSYRTSHYRSITVLGNQIADVVTSIKSFCLINKANSCPNGKFDSGSGFFVEEKEG